MVSKLDVAEPDFFKNRHYCSTLTPRPGDMAVVDEIGLVFAICPKSGDATDDNAHFIVRACNSHAKLLDALRRIVEAPLAWGDDAFWEVQRIARAAIAEATSAE